MNIARWELFILFPVDAGLVRLLSMFASRREGKKEVFCLGHSAQLRGGELLGWWLAMMEIAFVSGSNVYR